MEYDTLHLLSGTPVIRLYPGCVQVGCDPGHELILSGLNPAQEEWLMGIAPHYSAVLRSYAPSPTVQEIPPECHDIARTLSDSIYTQKNNARGLDLFFDRVEEPIVAALESALMRGIVASFRLSDPRCSDHSSWAERSYAHGTAVSYALRQRLENLYPLVSRPTSAQHNLEVYTLSLVDATSNTSIFLSQDIPRLLIHLGQNSAMFGPVLAPGSPICVYCCAHWIHEQRRGIMQRSEGMPLPRLNPRVSAHVTIELDAFLTRLAQTVHTTQESEFFNSWHQRILTIDHDGRIDEHHLSPHPACGCSAGLAQPFTPLSPYPSAV